MKSPRTCFGCRKAMKKPATRGGVLCLPCWEREKMLALYYEPICLDKAAMERPVPPEVAAAEAEVQKMLDLLFRDAEDES